MYPKQSEIESKVAYYNAMFPNVEGIEFPDWTKEELESFHDSNFVPNYRKCRPLRMTDTSYFEEGGNYGN